MARKSRMEQLSVVADPWNLKLKPAKLKGGPLDLGWVFTPHHSAEKNGSALDIGQKKG